MLEIVKELVVPSNFAFLLAIVGFALAAARRTRAKAIYFLGTAVVLLFVFSSGRVAALLLSPLEYQYPRVSSPLDARAQHIVVLAAYAADDSNMPLSSRPNSSALYRIVEAVHLKQRCKTCRLIVSGSPATVNVMAQTLESLGVPATDITLDRESLNTAQSAQFVRGTLKRQYFYLVTSAGHMPRAIGLFRKQDLQPIAAPTDFQMPKQIQRSPWRPSSMGLAYSDLAVHEHVGIWWYRLSDQIN